MSLADQNAAQAKKWQFLTTTGGVRAVLYPDSQGHGALEFFGTNVSDALTKASAWDDYRSKMGKTTTGIR